MVWGGFQTIEEAEQEIEKLKVALRSAVELAEKHSDLWTREDYQRLSTLRETAR